MTSLSPESPPTESSPEPLRQKRSPKRPILIIGLLLGIGGAAYWYWSHRPSESSAILHVSGRIEGYETDIGAKVPGRIAYVAVREGDAVHKGQVVARLDDDELMAQHQAAIAQVSAAQQQANQAHDQIAVLQSQIEEAQLNYDQSQDDTLGRISQSQAQVAAAQTQLDQAQAQVQQVEADLELARKDRDRFAQLLQAGAVAQQQMDRADAAYDKAIAALSTQKAAVATAQKQVLASQGALTQVKTTRLNPNIRLSRIDTLRKQVVAAQSQWQAAQDQVKSAQANVRQIQARLADLAVKSPIDGVVLDRTVEPGTVVANGKTLLTVLNPDTVYLRGFVPEGQVGKVHIGQAATVTLDSNPNQPLKAHVIAVDTSASFTPENIYFKEDRVRQVFGVKIGIDQPQGLAKPGMPADVELQLQQTS